MQNTNLTTRRELLFGGAAGLLGLSAACSGGTSPSPDPTPEPQPRSVMGRILTNIFRHGDPARPGRPTYHVLAMRPDGTSQYIFEGVQLQAASPNGSHLVTISVPGDVLEVWNLETGTRTPLPPNTYVTRESFSPGGQYLLAYTPVQQRVINDGEYFEFLSGTVWLYTADGQLIRKLFIGPAALDGSAFPGWLSASEPYVALIDGAYRLGLDGVLGEKLNDLYSQIVSPDGRYMAGTTVTDFRIVKFVEISSRTVRTIDTGLDVAYQNGWSRDSRFAFFSGLHQGVWEVIRFEAATGNIQRFPLGNPADENNVAAIPSPDGESFAVSKGVPTQHFDLVVQRGTESAVFPQGGQPIAWL